MTKGTKTALVILACCFVLCAALILTVFLILTYGKTTDAYLSYEESEIPYSLIESIVEKDLYHGYGTYRHGMRERDFYYQLKSFSSEQAVIVKRTKKGEEDFVLLYHPDQLENPYTLWEPKSMTLRLQCSEEDETKMTFSIGSTDLVTAFWGAFLEEETIPCPNAEALTTVFIGENEKATVVLAVLDFTFTLSSHSGTLYWRMDSWDSEQVWLIPYDASVFDPYLSLYTGIS